MQTKRWAAALVLSSAGIVALTGCMGPAGVPVYMALPNPEVKPVRVPRGPDGNPVIPCVEMSDDAVRTADLKARGAAELAANRVETGRRYYQRALKIAPADDEAKLGLANSYYRLGYYAKASCLAQEVMAGGGCHTPYAAQLEVAMQTASGNHREARAAAQLLARWAEANGQPLQAVDAHLTAARLSAYHLNDGPATWEHIGRARALLRGTDREALARIDAFERDIKRECAWYRLCSKG
jgi:tetratricopeptide (TPR) repeat protein